MTLIITFVFSFFANVSLYCMYEEQLSAVKAMVTYLAFFIMVIIVGLLVQLKEQNEQIQLELSTFPACEQE